MNFKFFIKLIIKLPWPLGLSKVQFHQSSSKMLTPAVLPGSKNSKAVTPGMRITSLHFHLNIEQSIITMFILQEYSLLHVVSEETMQPPSTEEFPFFPFYYWIIDNRLTARWPQIHYFDLSYSSLKSFDHFLIP